MANFVTFFVTCICFYLDSLFHVVAVTWNGSYKDDLPNLQDFGKFTRLLHKYRSFRRVTVVLIIFDALFCLTAVTRNISL